MRPESKTKWNYGFTFEYLCDLTFSISTDKPFDEITAEEMLTAIELRLASLRNNGDVIESVELWETVEYADE